MSCFPKIQRRVKLPSVSLSAIGLAVYSDNEAAKFFITSFGLLYNDYSPTFPTAYQSFNDQISCMQIFATVEGVLKNLDSNLSMRPDDVNFHHLKSCSISLSIPLTIII